MSSRLLPGRRLGWVLLLGTPLLTLPGWGLLAMGAYDVCVLLLAALEARALRRVVPEVTRELDPRLLLGAENFVRLRLRSGGDRPLQLSVRDDYPQGFAVDQSELSVRLPAHGRRELRYSVTPPRRGLHSFGDLHLRLEGATGLGSLLLRVEAAQEVPVYPNLRGPRRFELAARLGSLRSVGVRRMRRPGGGGEFEQLREYVPGDPMRDLDWKASAKRRRPITRVHGQEHQQNVVVAIDAGRMMAAQLDDITKLDHAIHAALLLCHVALRGGDKVGLLVFAEDVLRFVPPARGAAQYRRILESLYTVEAGQGAVDFRRLVQFVRTRLPRRSLLVMFSDLLDEAQAAPLAAQAPLLRKKHLPLCVTMTDPVARALAQKEPANDEDVYRRAAAADLLADREAVKLSLTKRGVGIVEAPVGELAVAAVNRYLDIKSRHAL